jgi:hypothetical protein
MNKKFAAAIARLGALPEDRQEAAAALLLDFLEREEAVEFTPEELDELERYIEELIAEQMVKDFFARAKSQGDRSRS